MEAHSWSRVACIATEISKAARAEVLFSISKAGLDVDAVLGWLDMVNFEATKGLDNSGGVLDGVGGGECIIGVLKGCYE